MKVAAITSGRRTREAVLEGSGRERRNGGGGRRRNDEEEDKPDTELKSQEGGAGCG